MEGQNNFHESTPRDELRKLIKEELLAAKGVTFDAEEREKKAEKGIEELLNKHPELVEEVDKIQEHFMKTLG